MKEESVLYYYIRQISIKMIQTRNKRKKNPFTFLDSILYLKKTRQKMSLIVQQSQLQQ